MSYHIMYYIISYHTMSYHIISSYHVLYHIIPCHIISYHVLYHIIPYHIISCHFIYSVSVPSVMFWSLMFKNTVRSHVLETVFFSPQKIGKEVIWRDELIDQSFMWTWHKYLHLHKPLLTDKLYIYFSRDFVDFSLLFLEVFWQTDRQWKLSEPRNPWFY